MTRDPANLMPGETAFEHDISDAESVTVDEEEDEMINKEVWS